MRRWSVHHGYAAWWSALLLAQACSSTSYVLELKPVLPTNQTDLLSERAMLRLLTSSEATGSALRQDEVLVGGQATARGVGDLSDEWLEVVLEQEGGELEPYDPSRLLAYGEVGPLSLSREADVVSQSLLVASTNGVGALLDAATPRVLSALAMTSTGDTYFFGGADGGDSGPGVTTVQRLSGLDAGEWGLEDAGTLPEGLVGSRATVVGLPGGEQILVSGGQRSIEDHGPYESTLHLYDPVTGSVTWSGESVHRHAHHVALALDSTRVLLIGAGFDDDRGVPSTPSGEIVDTETRTSTDLDAALSLGHWFPAGVLLDDGRALVCGGARMAFSGLETTSYDGCIFVDADGDVEIGPILPEPRAMHAMVRLADGRVLLTGGTSESVGWGATKEAASTAWLWSPGRPNKWVEIGEMNRARAHHRMVLRNDGKVWVLGGSSDAGVLTAGYSNTPRCHEIFDPDSETFTTADTCHASGAGAEISVAWHSRHGVVTLEGLKASGSGGEAVGYLPMGPTK